MATKEEIFKIGENYKSEQLEAQSRAAIKAWCDDPSVEIEFCDKVSLNWMIKDHVSFNTDMYYYRIAKPKKWYRVGEDANGGIMLVRNDFQESRAENRPEFKRWLTEGRKYYD